MIYGTLMDGIHSLLKLNPINLVGIDKKIRAMVTQFLSYMAFALLDFIGSH